MAGLFSTADFTAFGFLTLGGVTFCGLYESWKNYEDLHQVKKFPNYIPPAVEEGGTIESPESHTNSVPPPAQDGYYYIRGKLTTNRPIRVVDSQSRGRDQRQQQQQQQKKQQQQQQQQRQRQKERERDDENEEEYRRRRRKEKEEEEEEEQEQEQEERDGDKDDGDDEEEKEPTLSPFAISPSASPFAPQASFSSSSSSLLDPLYDFAICQYELYQVLDEDKPSSKLKEEQSQRQEQEHELEPEPELELEQPGNKESEPEFIHFVDNSMEGDDAAYKKNKKTKQSKKQQQQQRALLFAKNKSLSPSPSPFSMSRNYLQQKQSIPTVKSSSKNRKLIFKSSIEYTPLYIRNIDVNEFKSYIPLSTVFVKYSKTPYLKESKIDTNMSSLVDTIEKELKKWFGVQQKKSPYNSYSHSQDDNNNNAPALLENSHHLSEQENALLGGVEIPKSNGKRSYEESGLDSNEQGDGASAGPVAVTGGYEHEWKGIKNEEVWTVIGVWDGYNKIEPKAGLYCDISRYTIEEMISEKKKEIAKQAIAGVSFVCIGTVLIVWRWRSHE